MSCVQQFPARRNVSDTPEVLLFRAACQIVFRLTEFLTSPSFSSSVCAASAILQATYLSATALQKRMCAAAYLSSAVGSKIFAMQPEYSST